MSTQKTGILGPQEVERLLAEKMPDIRIDIVNKIAASHSARHYSLSEIAIAEQILRIMVRDTELSVRQALAIRLQDNAAIPHDIILSLVNDEDSVALPLIEHSPVLTDAELIALVASCQNIRKLEAVAARNPVSQEVAASLIDTRQDKVVTTLARNPHADIPYEKYYEMIKDYSKNTELMDALGERPNLPVTIVEKIIHIVSGTLAEKLQGKYAIASEKISAESDKNREVATLRLVGNEEDKTEVEKLVDQLLAFNRLTPSIILTSLCRGNLYFFETSLARLSGIPVKNAHLLIHDRGNMGFRALYNKADLPEKFFASCQLLLETVSEMQYQNLYSDHHGYANSLVTRLLAKTAEKPVENLSYIIALIRQAA